MTASARPSEMTLPVASLSALRDGLVDAVGAEAAANALRLAGYAAGDTLFTILQSRGRDAGEVSAPRFWSDLERLFASRGWGRMTFAPLHEGVGSLEASDWAEARVDTAAASTATSCHITTGLLANVLGQVAGGEVAVLEVECRSRGDQRCRFLFGGAEAVYRVYEEMAAGTAADHAVAQLR